jgi:hypothetical protein
MQRDITSRSPLFYSRVAGIAYLVIIITAMINVSFIDAKLIVPGDSAATIENIIAGDLLFRIGMVCVVIIYASVIVLSWALYVLLKPVNKNMALLALLLRTTEALVGAVTIFFSFVVLYLVSGEMSSNADETSSMMILIESLLNARTAALDIVLIFVGLGGTVFCYLLFISLYIPKILALWGIFTYGSMLVLALLSMLSQNHPVIIETVLYGLGSLFELIIGCWLLIKGIDLKQSEHYTSVH